jgi:hypothetical protein
VFPHVALKLAPVLGSSSEVNQSNEGKTMEVMTSLPFLSAVALSTGKKEKKQKLEANAEFFLRNSKSIFGMRLVCLIWGKPIK